MSSALIINTSTVNTTESTVMEPWQDEYTQHLLGVFGLPGRRLVAGDGVWVRDDKGNEYLDGLAGIAVNSLGHNHSALVAALRDQVGKLIHVSNYFATDPQIGLAERLVRITGGSPTARVFFANSGTEANEAAFKVARAYGGTARPTIIALEHAFHGRTLGSLSLTPKPSMQDPFQPLAANVKIIPGTIEALEAAVDETTAAVFAEPVQGEAGVLPVGDEFLQAARRITTEHGALLVIDEVQTGIGRTGEWFGHTTSGIVPDVITMAKGLGGGVPIGAVVLQGAAAGVLHQGEHGSTFGGNPLATRAGCTVIDTIERDHLLANVRERGKQLRTGLAKLPGVANVRGKGMLIGVVLERPNAHAVVEAALDAGLIINAPADAVLRIAPPLILSADDADLLIARTREALIHVGF